MIREIVRKLRRKQTPCERILWERLRNRKLNGLKFRRQYPIVVVNNGRKRFFAADFCCPEKKLIVEADGGIHHYQKEQDQERDELL